MVKNRNILKVSKSIHTVEGAGVHLKRAFGNYNVNQLDPFLLLDDFHSGNPDDYMAGFPWHPHRGIETVTYMLNGKVKHEDSIGNRGVIRSGDIQWMTAGSGIIHSEMPQKTEGVLRGLQLWVNLPASHKMMNPRYREVLSTQIPELILTNGTKIKIISGEIEGTRGPVKDIMVDIVYLDISIPAGANFEMPVKEEYTAFSYLLEGNGYFSGDSKSKIEADHLVIFDKGDFVSVTAGDISLHFLFLAGKPLHEPIAWQGPIVMNTEEELEKAFIEYQNGTFIK